MVFGETTSAVVDCRTRGHHSTRPYPLISSGSVTQGFRLFRSHGATNPDFVSAATPTAVIPSRSQRARDFSSWVCTWPAPPADRPPSVIPRPLRQPSLELDLVHPAALILAGHGLDGGADVRRVTDHLYRQDAA